MTMPGGMALICTANSNLHRKKIKGFKCERSAATNASFTAFVQDTGYVTEAERLGRSFVFYDHVAPEHVKTQGDFPTKSLALDGYDPTVTPIGFEPNCYGLDNTVGDVWKWTRDPFRMHSARTQNRKASSRARNSKLPKGGSFLCHADCCMRYRITACTGNTPDSASSHTGFRAVYADG